MLTIPNIATINNKLIEQKSFHEDLGITYTFTNDLSWEALLC